MRIAIFGLILFMSGCCGREILLNNQHLGLIQDVVESKEEVVVVFKSQAVALNNSDNLVLPFDAEYLLIDVAFCETINSPKKYLKIDHTDIRYLVK